MIIRILTAAFLILMYFIVFCLARAASLADRDLEEIQENEENGA